MQVLGSFFNPGFLAGPISSFANALPSASPNPIRNAPALPLPLASVVHVADDAIVAWFNGLAKDTVQGTKALTEQALTTRARSTRAKFIIGGLAEWWVVTSTSTSLFDFLVSARLVIGGIFISIPVILPPSNKVSKFGARGRVSCCVHVVVAGRDTARWRGR